MKDRDRRSSESAERPDKRNEREENDKQILRMPSPEEIEKKEEQSLKVEGMQLQNIIMQHLKFSQKQAVLLRSPFYAMST